MSASGAANTEDLIKNTAREVFIQKGLDGARMQDIADKAGINKALLHYYFRSKEKLFEIIFDEERKIFLSFIGQVLNSNLSLFEKIEKVVEKQIENLIERPYLPQFILGEIVKRPELLMKKMEEAGFLQIKENFIKEVNQEIRKGTIKSTVSGEQLILNIMSLNIFPFIGEPFLTKLFATNKEHYMKLMKKRKKEIAEFIIDAIKI